jgi:hypothetical protein
VFESQAVGRWGPVAGRWLTSIRGRWRIAGDQDVGCRWRSGGDAWLGSEERENSTWVMGRMMLPVAVPATIQGGEQWFEGEKSGADRLYTTVGVTPSGCSLRGD